MQCGVCSRISPWPDTHQTGLSAVARKVLRTRLTFKFILFFVPCVSGFIHSFHWHVQNATIPCRSQVLLPFLSVMYFSCHPSPPTILPSSLTLSCHLFLGLPLSLAVPKFIYNTLLGIYIFFQSLYMPKPNLT